MSEYSKSSSLNDTEEWVDPYIQTPLKEILIVTFMVTFFLGLSGNLLVIFVIARNRSMHTVTNFFLANLAVADLLVSVFCVIPKLLYYVSSGWFYGDFLCKIHNYVMSATTTSSIFILTVISFERFIAILRPLETRRLLTARRLTVAMAAVWIASATFNIHTIWYYEVTYDVTGIPYCSPSDYLFEMDVHTSKIQTLVFFCLYYVIPLTVMVVLYGFICQKLWVSSKLRLVASDSERKDSGHGHRGFIHRLARVRYLIKPREQTTPSVGKQDKDQGCGNVPAVQQQPALSNPEEVQVLLETQMSNESSAGGDQKIGPFFLDEPEDDSAPSSPVDQTSIYKPGANHQNVCIRVDFAGNNNAGKGADDVQETTLNETLNGPTRTNGHSLQNHDAAKTAQAGRPSQERNRLSPPRPLTISKPERSKSKKNKKKETIAARKKVIKLLVVVVSSFALCLLPYQIVTLWMTVGTNFPHQSMAMQIFLPMTYLCYFFNSALNPFLYAFLSDNFRKRMKETLTLRSSTRRRSWMRTQARLRSMTEGNTETETVYT